MSNAKATQAAKTAKNYPFVFFLGGADAEMVRIAEVIGGAGCA